MPFSGGKAMTIVLYANVQSKIYSETLSEISSEILGYWHQKEPPYGLL